MRLMLLLGSLSALLAIDAGGGGTVTEGLAQRTCMSGSHSFMSDVQGHRKKCSKSPSSVRLICSKLA